VAIGATVVSTVGMSSSEAHTRIIWRRCWPDEDDSWDRSPHSNNSEALLARRRQLEGPKPALEKFGGVVGPMKMIRGTRTPTLE
jgi:hypothetical protein